MKRLFTFLLLSAMAVGAKAQSYCIPAPTGASASCSTYHTNITLFQLTGASGAINDTTSCDGTGYKIDSLSSVTLNVATGYSAYINTGSLYNMNCQVWIDYNDDGTFQTTESVGGMNNYTDTSGGRLFSITIGYARPSGTHRMRVVATYSGYGYSYPSLDPCMSGYYYGEARDYYATIAGGTSSGCTGTPTGGTVSASTSSGCAATSLTLVCSGYTTGTGISLQWQSSPDGATWTDISGAVSATLVVASPSATTYYRCAVTCSSSSSTGYSSSYVATVDAISGHIAYDTTAPDTTSLQVWLIYHDTAAGTLTAIDSVITCQDSTMPFYHFSGMGSGNYLVKAQSLDWTSSTPGMSGFVPTYGASNTHWSGATTISHTTGSTSVQDITMNYGVVPSGAGFIGGLISSGAGRGTSGDIPAVHMLVYLKNATTGIVTYTYTDATGAYSFGSLGNGSYYVYPEKLNDSTVPSAMQTLSATAEILNGINFKEFTTSKIIKPVTEGVAIQTVPQTLTVFPNPATSSININWNEMPSGEATLTVTDMTGREVYHSAISVANASGSAHVALPGLVDGAYLLRITSAVINYTEKLTIQK